MKGTVIILFVLIAYCAFAQEKRDSLPKALQEQKEYYQKEKKFAIEIFGGATYTYPGYDWNTPFNSINAKVTKKIGGWQYSYGARIKFKVIGRINILSGFSFNTLRYEFNRDIQPVYNNNFEKDLYSFSVFNVPFLIQAELIKFKKITWNIAMGKQVSIFSSNNYRIERFKNNQVAFGDWRQIDNGTKMTGIIINSGIDYKISRRFSINLQGEYQYSKKDMVKDFGYPVGTVIYKFYLKYYCVLLGIDYHF